MEIPKWAAAGQAVGDVVASDQRGMDFLVLGSECNAESRAVESRFKDRRGNVGRLFDPVGDGAARRFGVARAAAGIVDVDDRQSRRLQVIEDSQLALPVRLERFVVIEMVLRDIGDDGRVEQRSRSAALIEGVA
jgi:hypothetical protein